MIPSHSEALVLFGVTGDLAHKMIFPALYAPAERCALEVPVIGVALPKWSLDQLDNRVKDRLNRHGVDGALIGGVSLQADQFLAIVRAGAGEHHAEGSSTSTYSRSGK